MQKPATGSPRSMVRAGAALLALSLWNAVGAANAAGTGKPKGSPPLETPQQ